MSAIPNGFDTLRDPMQGEPMEIDNLTSGVDESPMATGDGKEPDPKPNQNQGKANAMEISEDNHGERITSLPSLDLADRIKGYRLLELISEQASNGLGKSFVVVNLRAKRYNKLAVSKVIISQEPLSRFINYVSPGSYTSLTHVNFSALDQFMIKPIGVYGSKPEIVRLLLEINAIDEETYVLIFYWLSGILMNPQQGFSSFGTTQRGIFTYSPITRIWSLHI